LVERITGARYSEAIEIEAANDHAVEIGPLPRLRLQAQDEVAIGCGEIVAQRPVALLPVAEIGGGPAPEIALPPRPPAIVDLQPPIEAGAERMRVDIVVEELRLVQADAGSREPRRDLPAEHRILPVPRLRDRHVDVDIRPDHEVVADTAGD